MSRPVWLPATDVPLGRVLPFPTMAESQAPKESELGGALTFASGDNLVLEITSLLNWAVHHKDSMTEDMLLTLLGDVLAIRVTRCEPMTVQIERHRAFLSDISAKQARKRRRRQKRVRQDVELSA